MKKDEMELKILENLADGSYFKGGKWLAIGMTVGCAIAAAFCDIYERKCTKDCNNLSWKYVNGEYEPDEK